jgi:hypothetical protein
MLLRLSRANPPSIRQAMALLISIGGAVTNELEEIADSRKARCGDPDGRPARTHRCVWLTGALRKTMPARLRRTIGMSLRLLAVQGAWFCCVLGAARGKPGAGEAVVALVCCVQLALSPARRQELVLACAAAALGLLWDTALLRAGVVEYASPGPVPGWAPGWILALWLLFATLLREPLQWLQGRWLTAALLGGAGGALSYLSAVRLGAGHFRNIQEAMWVLGLGWALMTPMLTELARRLAARRETSS